MSKSEISRIRSLLTARGDFWDLRWDIEQLERAWRNEIVTIPPIRVRNASESESHSLTHNNHWNFISTGSAWTIPHAKVYLKPAPHAVARTIIKSMAIQRYRIHINVLSIDGQGPTGISGVVTSLFVVKGNPLIVSSVPLPCLANGDRSVALEVRVGEDLSNLSLQVVLVDLSNHFAIPMDELLEQVGSNEAGIERTVSLWDCQTGLMRGDCTMSVRVEKENPYSVAEVIDHRRKQRVIKEDSSAEEKPVLGTISPETVVSGTIPTIPPDANIMTPVRDLVEPVDDRRLERDVLLEERKRLENISPSDRTPVPEMQGRRRRQANNNFSVPSDPS